MEVIKIVQFHPETWEGNDGKKRTDFVGLGDDGKLYKWHRGTGKWILNVIQS